MPTKVFAPAKVNLCLHVTGQRADGYHSLQSLVAFADVGDWVQIDPAPEPALAITGPRAAGVPTDASNLCLRALALTGRSARITLEKHLPAAAGIGGGSADAAAVLRAVAIQFDDPLTADVIGLGADVPVCLESRAALMGGIGEEVTPRPIPPLSAVLVNPGVPVPTGPVFQGLRTKTNPPMPQIPAWRDAAALIAWLKTTRNDLEPPARALEPAVQATLDALSGAVLARMSGSGATCFGLYADGQAARAAARAIAAAHPAWWVVPVTLS